MIWKISPLLKIEILGVFDNTLTTDDKYHVQDCENLLFPNQRKLSFELKTYSILFVPFLESSSNFKYFQKKKIVIVYIFPKLQTVKDLVRALSKKHYFGTFFESQHAEGSQTLLKSGSEHFYHIFSSL